MTEIPDNEYQKIQSRLKELEAAVAERKRTEKELIELRKAVESSGEIIFLTDREGLITYINPEFTAVYGFTAEEVVGKTTARILKSGKMKPEDYKMFWDTILGKKVVKGELVNKCKDGRLVTIEGSANPILDDQGEVIGFLAIQRDITDRKKLQDEIRARMREAEFVSETAVGRELKMMELEKEVDRLLIELGRAKKYGK